jgi:hypothetical protein
MGIYDGLLVVEACQSLSKLYSINSMRGMSIIMDSNDSNPDPSYWHDGLFKAVHAFFATSKAQTEQEEVLLLVSCVIFLDLKLKYENSSYWLMPRG